MKRLLIWATFLVLALSMEAVPQSEQPALKPAAPPTANQTRSSYVLEISYNSALPPAYIHVAGPETKARWIWVTKFNHVPGWRYPEGVLPIKAVKFEAQYNGETADVRVTVFRGRQGFDQEDLVGTYQLGLDDPRTVTKLENIGVEPARITLLNPAPVQPLWPEILNKTNSIIIEKITLDNDSLPGYRVIFRNQSDKALAALKVEVAGGNRGPISSLFQGEDGRPLIEPKGSSEQYLHALTQVVSGNPSAPVLPTLSTIVIRSAVFADGTYEGDSEAACMFEGFQIGRKVWVRTALTMFERELAEVSLEAPEAAAALKQKVMSLQFPESSPPYVSKVSRECVQTRAAIQATVNGQRLQLARELDRIITTRPAPPINFKNWLQSTIDRYRAWLARLQ